MKKILVTGNGKLAQALEANNFNELGEEYFILSLPRETMDITNPKEIFSVLSEAVENGFKYLIHTAAIAKPMNKVDEDPISGININIIGTANVAKACQKLGIKFIYISTDYVYQPTLVFNSTQKDIIWNSKESQAINPQNKYAWSKMGGECITQLIPSSLILRCALTDIPFRHKKAYKNVYKNSITHNQISPIILKLVDEKGIINVGGDYKSIFEFVKEYQKDIEEGVWEFENKSVHLKLNLDKLKTILNGST